MIFDYDELKECVEEDFNRFYKEMKFDEDQIYPAVLNEYEHGDGFSQGENACIHVFLVFNYLKNGLNIEKIVNELKKLMCNESSIKKELGEQYSKLVIDINSIKD